MLLFSSFFFFFWLFYQKLNSTANYLLLKRIEMIFSNMHDKISKFTFISLVSFFFFIFFVFISRFAFTVHKIIAYDKQHIQNKCNKRFKWHSFEFQKKKKQKNRKIWFHRTVNFMMTSNRITKFHNKQSHLILNRFLS